MERKNACFHLPGLFEFFDFYRVFLPLFYNHREYFYEQLEIGSIYGSPENCLWNGGRTDSGNASVSEVLSLLEKYGISGRLTFSNSLLKTEHLSDRRSIQACEAFSKSSVKNGVIVHSEILLDYLMKNFPELYLVSSTTKVILDFEKFKEELNRAEFRYAVPDFRLNKAFEKLETLSSAQKDKVEFLLNECCWTGCTERKLCYENVSRKNLGEDCAEHFCKAPGGNKGYRFSEAMKNPSFISLDDIQKKYIPSGFSNFKIEGRGLGNAVLLEFLLYYMTKPEYQLKVREELYLDSMLDLF